MDIDSIITDVHAAAGVLTMFFRELPDPLFPRNLYAQLMAAARIDDARLRLIQVHELVNILPDANYATLRFLAHHLSE